MERLINIKWKQQPAVFKFSYNSGTEQIIKNYISEVDREAYVFFSGFYENLFQPLAATERFYLHISKCYELQGPIIIYHSLQIANI